MYGIKRLRAAPFRLLQYNALTDCYVSLLAQACVHTHKLYKSSNFLNQPECYRTFYHMTGNQIGDHLPHPVMLHTQFFCQSWDNGFEARCRKYVLGTENWLSLDYACFSLPP